MKVNRCTRYTFMRPDKGIMTIGVPVIAVLLAMGKDYNRSKPRETEGISRFLRGVIGNYGLQKIV